MRLGGTSQREEAARRGGRRGTRKKKKRSCSLTRHADTSERPRIVQAGAVVLTGMGLALVHVRLAPWSCESLRAVAAEGAGRVHADTVVFAGGSWKKREQNIRAWTNHPST